jgi:hypothetical protein
MSIVVFPFFEFMFCELAVLFCFPWKASKQVTMGPVESFHGMAKTVHLFPQNSGNLKKMVEALKVSTESVETIKIQWKVIQEEQS